MMSAADTGRREGGGQVWVGVGASTTVVDLGERRRALGGDGGCGAFIGTLWLDLLDGALNPIQTIKTVTRGKT